MQELKLLTQNIDTVFTQEKLEKLSGQLVEFQRAKRAFGKSQSQWMDINLILSKPTPIRNARQALAHIEKSYAAIKETEYKIKKLMVEKEIKQRDWKRNIGADDLKLKLIKIEIEEIEHQISSAAYYFEGALKTVQTYIDAYESICKEKGIKGFDEHDFEKEEEEYHIKTALLQSMRSVRQMDRIDQGNQEYLEQCGINPSAIELAIQGFLRKEKENSNERPIDFSTTIMNRFVDQVFQDLQGSSSLEADKHGINKLSESALYRRG